MTPDDKRVVIAYYDYQRRIGNVDEEMVPFLDRMNAVPWVCTMVSCYGHIHSGSPSSMPYVQFSAVDGHRDAVRSSIMRWLAACCPCGSLLVPSGAHPFQVVPRRSEIGLIRVISELSGTGLIHVSGTDRVCGVSERLVGTEPAWTVRFSVWDLGPNARLIRDLLDGEMSLLATELADDTPWPGPIGVAEYDLPSESSDEKQHDQEDPSLPEGG